MLICFAIDQARLSEGENRVFSFWASHFYTSASCVEAKRVLSKEVRPRPQLFVCSLL